MRHITHLNEPSHLVCPFEKELVDKKEGAHDTGLGTSTRALGERHFNLVSLRVQL